MGLVESFCSLQDQYFVDVEDIEEFLQCTNPKTDRPYFKRIEKKGTVKFVKKGLWSPYLLVKKIDGRILLAFMANIKLRWSFRFLFEGIVAASVAVALTYFVIPFATPIFYASVLTVLLPLLIFFMGIIVARAAQKKCIEEMIEDIEDLTQKKAVLCKKKMRKIQVPSRGWLGVFLPSLLGIFLALGVAFGSHSLAWDYWCKGDYVKSEYLCRPVQKIVNYVLGEDNSISADSNYYLAECLRCQGKNKEALDLYKKSMQQMQKFLGDNHIYVADNCYGIAKIYDAQEKYDNAEEFYSKAIAIYAQQFPNYPNVAKMRNRLAMVFAKQKKFELAEQEQRKALDIDKLYGNSYQGVAENLNDLGCILYGKGDLQAARDTFLKCLDMKVRCFGKKHYSLYVTFYNLKVVNQKLQNKDAEVYSNWAQECFQKYFPQVSLLEGDACAKRIFQKYHHDYEIPNFFSRCNATITFERHY